MTQPRVAEPCLWSRVIERKQLIRQLVALLLLAAVALLLVLFEYPDRGFSFRPVTVASEAQEAATYSLVEASRAVGLLRENYAFQSRLQPRRMLVAALQGIEEQSDTVLVAPAIDLEDEAWDSDEKLPGTITVQSRARKAQFDIREVSDLYQMAWKLMEVFDFLQPDGEKPTSEMEDAAIEGLLTVLDPHTTYLTEAAYKDMKLSTRGSFGGLGIVISVREGKLKVISVMAGTPAARGGLQKGDHIVQIDQESTVNMLVSEAANRLRGKPGSEITLRIMREGEATPRSKTLVREVIKVKSVLAQNLDGRTAYVRVKGFQTNTAQEVKSFLDTTYAAAPPTGIILDLRGNSGGVMQSAVDLADLFLDRGRVVATVARVREGTQEEPSETGDRYENAALIVLVDHGSASASEIVTGALKYRNRALVIGTRTFGKGSVQYVQPLSRGALKLTVSQYVGPNMEVIQGRGIEPHIQIRPLYTGEGFQMPTFADEFEGEGALPYRLEETGAEDIYDPPEACFVYLPDGQGPEAMDSYDEVVIDFPVRFAWALLGFERKPLADRMLDAVLPLVDDIAEYAQEDIGLFALTEGVDWRPAPIPGRADIELALSFAPEPLAAGSEGTLTVTATNRGDTPWPRVVARTESTNYRFDGRSCLLGLLEPGLSKQCRIAFEMPATSPRRQDPIFVDLQSGLTLPLASDSLSLTTDAAPLPRIALSYTIDDHRGNRDNWLQVGEEVDLVLTVHNLGQGTLTNGLATLKDLSGPALFITNGRVDLEDLAPGQSTTLRLTMTVQELPEDGLWRFQLGIVDLGNRRHLSATQELPLAEGDTPPETLSRFLYPLPDGSPVVIGPRLGAPVMGQLTGSGGVQVVARKGEWLKLQLPGRRWGWARRSDLTTGITQELADFHETWVVVEPRVFVSSVTPGALMGDADSLTLQGVVDFGAGHTPADAAIALYRNGRKVSLNYLGDLHATSHLVPFVFQTELVEGINRVLVEAQQKNQSPGYGSVYYNRLD